MNSTKSFHFLQALCRGIEILDEQEQADPKEAIEKARSCLERLAIDLLRDESITIGDVDSRKTEDISKAI